MLLFQLAEFMLFNLEKVEKAAIFRTDTTKTR